MAPLCRAVFVAGIMAAVMCGCADKSGTRADGQDKANLTPLDIPKLVQQQSARSLEKRVDAYAHAAGKLSSVPKYSREQYPTNVAALYDELIRAGDAKALEALESRVDRKHRKALWVVLMRRRTSFCSDLLRLKLEAFRLRCPLRAAMLWFILRMDILRPPCLRSAARSVSRRSAYPSSCRTLWADTLA